MDKDQLLNELENFNLKLKGKQNIDENLKENLTKLIDDIYRFLNNPKEASNKEKESLIENLRDSTMNFETKHPELSESLNIIVHTLSNMGI